ncbi:MAG: hemerythrin domain-containing protein [Sterolibacteriaceae bacterium]|nr:hemerythrin domain-containing protein [Candidatus Methylophosphatis haderslevensis]
MPAIVWSDSHELGLLPMDETHREFVELVNRIADSGDSGLLAGLDQLILHTVEHFAQEDRWMRESGFPPVHCHQTEHERVLEVMRDVRDRIAAGDLALGRNLIAELPAWFDNHAATMDTALAWHVQTTGYRATAGAIPASAPVAAGAAGCGCGGGGGSAGCG